MRRFISSPRSLQYLRGNRKTYGFKERSLLGGKRNTLRECNLIKSLMSSVLKGLNRHLGSKCS